MTITSKFSDNEDQQDILPKFVQQGLLPAPTLCGEAGYFLALYSAALYAVGHLPAILDRTVSPGIQVGVFHHLVISCTYSQRHLG
jgi:hypothetical protein